MSISFTINTLILTKKNYDSEDLNERHEKFFDPNQFKILGEKKPKSDSTEEILRESRKNHCGLK